MWKKQFIGVIKAFQNTFSVMKGPTKRYLYNESLKTAITTTDQILPVVVTYIDMYANSYKNRFRRFLSPFTMLA